MNQEQATPHRPSLAFAQFPEAPGILPGFQPLVWDDGAVRLWNRKYVLGDAGLLEQATNGGAPFLAGPVRMAGTANGWPLLDGAATRAVRSATAERVELVTTIAAKTHEVSVRTVVEYDGFMRVTVRVRGGGGVTLKDVALEIPLVASRCSYLQACSDHPRYKSGSISLPSSEGLVWESAQADELAVGDEEMIARYKKSRSSQIANTFLPCIWIGNHEGGLSWFAESDEGWQDVPGRSIIQVTRELDQMVLRVHMVMGEMSAEEATFDFGLQLTPVKPMPSGWRGWKFVNAKEAQVYGNDTLAPDLYDCVPGGASRAYLYANKGISVDIKLQHSRDIANPDILKKGVDLLHQQGHKVFPYICMDIISESRRNLDQAFLESASRVPPLVRKWTYEGADYDYHKVCLNSAENLADVLACVEQLVRDIGVDGIYLDNACYIQGCLAPSCCYRRPDGTLQPVFRLYQYREFMRKLAGVFVRHGKEPFIMAHVSSGIIPPVFSFATGIMGGENLMAYNYTQNHVQAYSEAKMVAELCGVPLGLIGFWYSDIKYPLFKKFNPDSPLTYEQFRDKLADSYIGMSLLYDTLCPGMRDNEFNRQIDEIRFRFGIGADDVAFHPYVVADARIIADNADVKVSYYTREQGLFVTAVNFSAEETRAKLTLPPSVLRILDQGRPLVEPFSGQPVSVEGDTIRVEIGPHGYTAATTF